VFGISLDQVILLLVLAFILFGPEKLPEYAEKLGRLVAKIRQASSEVTQEFNKPLQQFQSFENLKNLHSLQDLPEPPPIFKETTCPQCQKKLAHDFTFCPHCGHRLKETPGPQQTLAS